MSLASEVVTGDVTILVALRKMTCPLWLGSSRESAFSLFLPSLRCAWDSKRSGIYL